MSTSAGWKKTTESENNRGDRLLKSLFKLISLFTKHEKRRLIPITLAVLVSSVLGIVEVASLGPFITVAANPAVINDQRIIAFLYRLGGFDSGSKTDTQFLVFLGIVIFILIILITGFRAGVSYIDYRFIANRRFALSVRLFRQYLFQPYSFFLNQNTGELSKNLLSEVDMVINNVLRPAMDAFTRVFSALAIVIYLVILDPLVALLAAGVFGVMYFGLFSFVRYKLARHGKEARESNLLRFKYSQEAFGGINDIKILGKETYFINAFSQGARRFTASQTANQIYSSLPGQVMHSLAIGFAIMLMVLLLVLNGSLVEILPLLTVYSFAVVRLVPNLQQIFNSAAQIRFHSHTVNALYRDMTTLKLPPAITAKKESKLPAEPLPFSNNIELKKIEFFYPASREAVLKDISLMIAKNTIVAFAGTTGCGKTTLVDVIMGLLEPSAGFINVDGLPVIVPADGKDMRESISSWQRNFGYVAQQIYLSDDTVAANIAFGIPENLRDAAVIEQAAKTASLHEFIVNELPESYNTLIGERGIRLSGGQRQRLGIARALYHNPGILVMDEATSALDSITEDAVMDAIHKLMHTKTIIIIAHRLSTIRECDVIYLMEKGHIVASGTYNELLQNNAQFRAMAKEKDT